MKSRGLFAGLSIVLAAVTAGGLLCGPPANRMTAVPVHAHMVYNSETPDWFLSFFPLLHRDAQNFPMVGKSEGDSFQSLETHAGSTPRSAVLQRSWFQVLENRPLAMATVPFGGRERRDTWVAVSELGGPAALALRWRLMLFPPVEITPVRPHAAWSVWRFEHSSLPGWAKVRFAVTENLLICSISTDSHDIYRLIDTVDGRAVSKMKGKGR